MPRRVLIAGAVLLGAPVLQLVAERSVTLPIGPSRMLTIAVMVLALVPLARFGLERIAGGPLPAGSRALVLLLVPPLALCHLLACARLGNGPFGPVPGGPLRGPVASEPRTDWTGIAGARYAALEVLPERPRSLETLFLVHDRALYVAANMPEGKRWPGTVRHDGRVRVRIGDDAVHPRRAVWIQDDAETQQLLTGMNAKYGIDASLGGPIWFFRLDPRD